MATYVNQRYLAHIASGNLETFQPGDMSLETPQISLRFPEWFDSSILCALANLYSHL